MSAHSYEQIIYEVNDPVAVITMNRPEALNAFTAKMLAEIRHAFAAAEADERVVGIVLTGAGRGFSPGMDMNALDSMSSGDNNKSDDLSSLKASLVMHLWERTFKSRILTSCLFANRLSPPLTAHARGLHLL